MRAKAWLGLGLGVVGGGAAAIVIGSSGIACSTPSSLYVPTESIVQSLCASQPGQYPTAGCTEYAADAQACNMPVLSCPTTPCEPVSTSPCLAMQADNSGQQLASLRLRKLNVTAPPTLASSFVQKAVIDEGISLSGQCGEGGNGTFSWLIQFDTVNHTLRTGGAPPTSDPFGTGYCFVDSTINGIAVQPVTVPLMLAADGTWESGNIAKLNVPIYIPASVAGDSGVGSVVVLPLTNGKIEQMTLSENSNCIGHYNPSAVTPFDGGVCTDDPSVCTRWTTAGSLGAFITLNDADSVDVPQLSESLCVLLTQGTSIDTSNPSEKTCIKSGGNVTAKGNFCSTTNAAGGCADSYWLAATFAASAVKIVASNQPACAGGSVGGSPEAGPAEGGPAEASAPEGGKDAGPG